jgi:SPP1 family predicted phage head-tail adaptor
MKSGRLNRRVTIQQKVAGQDATGQPSLTWQDVVTTWGEFRTRNGAQLIEDSAIEISTVQMTLRIRYRAGLNAGMRVLLGSDVYEIKAVLPNEAKRDYVELLIAKGANDG